MSPRCCVCFLTDAKYILPTLLAATQARRHTFPEHADVAVFFFQDAAAPMHCRTYFAEASVDLIEVDRRLIGAMPIHTARLFLHEFLDPRYTEILYLDADIQITASLNDLVTATLPSGKLLAAPDPFVICSNWKSAQAKGLRGYFARVGFSELALQNYFNSGVIRVSAATWMEVSNAARRLIDTRSEPFRFADQDALNLVAADRCLPLSYKWNFPAFFRAFIPPELIEPNIEHFMSNPRPWFGPFRPWGWRAYTPYLEIVTRYPELAGMMKASALSYAKNALQQEYKRVVERRTWGQPAVLARIAEMEGRAFL